jgi:hypothetical protein
MELRKHEELSRKAAKMLCLNFDTTVDPRAACGVASTPALPGRGFTSERNSLITPPQGASASDGAEARNLGAGISPSPAVSNPGQYPHVPGVAAGGGACLLQPGGQVKKYTLTDEHRAMLKPWAEKWIANAMSTKPMDDTDREVMRVAVRGLYRAANLEPPPDHRIVFVPSPFVLRFAGGFAAAIWWMRKHGRDATDAATRAATYAATAAATAAATDAATDAATYDATYAATDAATDDATRAATRAATRDATYDATDDATDAATYDATYAATDDATYAATDAATYAATDAATRDATYAATDAATRAATAAATYDATREAAWYRFPCDVRRVAAETGAGVLGLKCAQRAYAMWQGGNQWSAWDSFLSFFRHVAKLDLPQYEAYQHWESAAIHGGPRIMHPDFCMISDRPSKLVVDAQNRPHCEDGPFCEWSDGSALYALNGVHVPEWLVMTPAEEIDPQAFARESNVEVRREIVRKIGVERLCEKLGSKVLDKSADGMYELHLVNLGDEVGEWPYLKMLNPSIGVYHMEAVEQGITTVEAALNFRNSGPFEHLSPVT